MTGNRRRLNLIDRVIFDGKSKRRSISLSKGSKNIVIADLKFFGLLQKKYLKLDVSAVLSEL